MTMRTLGIGMTLILVGSTGALASASRARTDEAILRELKQDLWPRAYRTQDVALLNRILDPGFQMTDGQGRRSSKSDELAWIRANKPSYDHFEFRIERLDVFDGHSAIVAGLGIISGVRDSKPYTHRYRSTNVLIKRDGEWRAVASHVSYLAKSR